MELLVVIAIFAVVVWFIFFRNKDDVKEALSEAPYKVEQTAPVPVSREVEEPVVTEPVTPSPAPAPVVEEPVAKATKAKHTAKPKAPKVAKTSTPRAKKPKMTVAK